MSEKKILSIHVLLQKLAREFAVANGIDGKKAYIAGMLHDIAKEMDKKQEDDLMESILVNMLINQEQFIINGYQHI
mgnify:CR=1 FL=1